MDVINPKHLERSIKRLAEGGVLQAIPEDVQADLIEFKEKLAISEDESEKEILKNAIEKIESKYMGDLITEDLVDEVDKEDGSVKDLSNGNWFKDNPSKLLGDLTVTKDRYSKEITILEGDISVLDKIDINDNFGQFIKNEGAVTSIKPPVGDLLKKHDNRVLVENIIKKSEAEIGRKAVRKQIKKEKKASEDFSMPESNIQTAEQIFQSKLNKDISQEAAKAYVWYKNEIGQRLSDNWYSMVYNDDDPRTTEQMVKDWVMNGVLFYVNGQLYPKPIFASGDMYQKYTRLVKSGENSGQDVQHIVDNYGQDVLKNHLEVLNEAWRKVYDKRLIITGGVDENSLVLKPISKFAKEYQIERTESMESLRWYRSGRKADYGKPDFNKTDTYGRGYRETFSSLSLTEAFVIWMITNKRKFKLKGNITIEDIIYFYIQGRTRVPKGNTPEEKARQKALIERTKAKSMTEGNALFLRFLQEDLSFNQKVAIETSWNATYNNYLKPNYDEIPVAFNVTENFHGEEPFVIKQEKRDAVSFVFNEGSGCLAYDVGVGKTMSSLMCIEQFIVAGYCKRPFIVVPNQTYKQWLSEIKNLLPHRTVNGLYNLRKDFLEDVKDENGNIMMMPEDSITVMTYQGFEEIGFGEKTERETLEDFYDILNQGGADEQLSAKKKAGLYEKLEELVGRGLEGTKVEIEKLGFDFMCFDEAHALKKVFTSVKGEAEEGKKKARKQYSIESGVPSSRALKGFMMSQYILRNNNYRNVLLLTATPFTNSPLEVFSMLSMVAYHQLAKLGLNNINDFFDNYIDVSTELVINHKMKPQYRQVVKGFNNLPSMQRIIMRFFDYKDGEMVGVPRPNKIMIPLIKEVVDGEVVNLPPERQVTSSIELSPLQQNFMDGVIAYAEGKGELEEYFGASSKQTADTEKSEMVDTQAEDVEEGALSTEEKAGVRALKSMNYSRNIALSPYLFEYSGLGEPTYTEYINTSPKLKYVIECIRSVKKYHEDNNEPVSGQVIYMDRGLKYFPLIQQYLIKELGYKKHEVGIISAKVSKTKAIANQNAFLGTKWNEKTQEFEPLSDAQRMKIIIGSSKIREGMNLQKKSTVLYNCFVDWNPTDFTQLAGRIWRQGNQYANVRLVNPLMIDSIDIFMFQKLEEKTARINTIWSNNGESVLKLEEIDPEDIKMSLIKDPEVLAMLQSEIRGNQIIDEISSYAGINERLQNYLEAFANINRNSEELTDAVKAFAPSKVDEDNVEKIRLLINFWKQDHPKDEKGRIMITNYDRNYNMEDILEKFGEDVQISPFNKPEKGWWFTRVVESKRLMDKETKDVLVPRNIEPNVASVKAYIEDGETIINKLKEEQDFLKSDDYIGEKIKEILAKREAEKFEIKTIKKLVAEFETLNPLLSEVKIKTPPKKKKPKYEDCRLLDKNGVPKIDDDSIAKLTECVEGLPQTKDLHTDVDGEYTDSRKKVHRAIIEEVKANAQCIETEQPIAILTGGSPASGKSSFLRHYSPFLGSEEIFTIDADEIRSKLPEYKGWNANSTHLETKDIVNTLLTDKEIGIPCKFDLIYDGTMNKTKNYLPLIGTLKRLGYKVFIVYMDNVPYETIRQRMLERYQKKGRFVPISVIDDFFSKGKAALDELKNKVDGYMVVDASNRDYNIIEEGGIKLPKERDYSQIGSPFTVEQARKTKKAVAETKKASKKAIKAEKAEVSDAMKAQADATPVVTASDLEKRLKTVQLMAKKNPALKARVKVVQLMLKKAKATEKATATTAKPKAKKIDVPALRKKMQEYFDKNNNDYYKKSDFDRVVKDEDLKKFKEAGVEDELIMGFYLGVHSMADFKGDVEVSLVAGLFTLGDDYVRRYIDNTIERVQKGAFEIGLKYPNLDWSKIMKGKPKEKVIETTPKDWGNYTQSYSYAIMSYSNGVLGKQYKSVRKYKDSGEEEIDLSYKGNFELDGGYVGIVSSNQKNIIGIIKAIAAQKDSYVKDLEVLDNGLGGIGASELDDANVKYEKGGSTYSNGGEVISDGGNYISINATKDRMVIKLNDDGREEVIDMKEDGKSSAEIMAFLFEDVVANSELQWHDDLGESGFGLTSASGVTDGYYYDDDGTYTSDYRRDDTRLYYFNDYALRSEIDDLLTDEGLVLTGADNKMANGGSIGHKKLIVRDIADNSTREWTVSELLDRINEDNASDEFNYDESDWLEGFKETLEGEYYSLFTSDGRPLNDMTKMAHGGNIAIHDDRLISQLEALSSEELADFINGAKANLPKEGEKDYERAKMVLDHANYVAKQRK